MDVYQKAYDRYLSRINANMLSRFEDARKNFENSLKLFDGQPTRLNVAYQIVRKELGKYQLNGDLIRYLDELARQERYKEINKFLRQ